MLMKALLINPPSEWNEIKVGEGILPPLGLLYLASVGLEKGHKIDFIDVRAEDLSKDQVREAIKKSDPDVVGLTAWTFSILNAYDIAEMAKEINPNVKTLCGGPHASALPERSVQESPYMDFAIYNEGEMTFVEILEKLEMGQSDWESVRGIAFRNGSVKKTLPRPLIPNLDVLPFPARQLLKWDKYTRLTHRTLYSKNVGKRYGTMMTSRGCPFQCTFCDRASSGRTWRGRSPRNVVDEMIHLKEVYGAGEITFHDDLFTINRQRVKEICKILIQEKVDITWACDARADCADQEMFNLMQQAGCTNVFFGVETGDEEMLKKIKKGETRKQLKDGIDMAKKAGLRVTGSFILGMPGETKETIDATINFAKEVNADISHFHIATPFPGSELFNQLHTQGKILTYDWSKYNQQRVEKIFEHENLTREQLEEAHKRAYREFYLRKEFIASNLKAALRNPAGFVKGGINFAKLAITGKGK